MNIRGESILDWTDNAEKWGGLIAVKSPSANESESQSDLLRIVCPIRSRIVGRRTRGPEIIVKQWIFEVSKYWIRPTMLRKWGKLIAVESPSANESESQSDLLRIDGLIRSRIVGRRTRGPEIIVEQWIFEVSQLNWIDNAVKWGPNGGGTTIWWK